MLIYFITVFPVLHAQSLVELENDMMHTYINDTEKMESKADRIYKIDPLNHTATYYLTTSLKNNEKYDLLEALYTKLRNVDTTSAVPYIMRAKFQYYPITISDTLAIMELKKAIAIDSTNFEANQLLGYSYYALFHENLSTYYAKQCSTYLQKAVAINQEAIQVLKYPLIQTSLYLQDTSSIASLSYTSGYYYNNTPATSTLYFPIDSFVELSIGWEKDYTQDVFHKANLASFILGWYSEHLKALDEPVLYTDSGKTVFRFTWLRSFHNPVAIRIENKGETYRLTWKVTDGAGGYAPGKLITNKSKIISVDEWNKFINLLEAAKYWNMPVISHDRMGTDGSQWILEGIQNGNYHVVDRWTPENSDYEKCGLYLIELTGLKVKRTHMY